MKAAAGARASHVRASPYRNRNSGGACYSTVIYDGALREAFTVPGGAEPLGRLMSPEVEEAAICAVLGGGSDGARRREARERTAHRPS